MCICIPSLVLLLASIALICSEMLGKNLLFSQHLLFEYTEEYRFRMVLGVAGNLVAMSLYLNMLSFMYGMRMYRLASVVELGFSVAFTIGSLVLLSMTPDANSLLLSHFVSLALAVFFGMFGLSAGVKQVAADMKSDDVQSEKPGEQEERGSRMSRFLQFGIAGMVGTFCWQGAEYAGYFMTLHRFGEESSGVFFVIMKLSQPLMFLAGATWAVLFSHVARRWEGGDRQGAIFVLETSFKAITLAVMSLTVLIYVTNSFWIRILGPEYRYSHYYLSGFLTFFTMVSNLSMLTIPAKLNEQPIVIAIAALAAGILIVLLSMIWMEPWGEVGAARAAGVGMYFAGGLVMLVYLMACRIRFHDSTYFMLGIPVILLFPYYLTGCLWLAILGFCLFSNWFLSPRQRALLRSSFGMVMAQFRRAKS